MKTIFVSTVSSEERIADLHRRTGRNPGFAIQKFNRLVAEGMALNGAEVECLSAPPIDTDQRGMVAWGEERVNGVHYRYLPIANWPVLRQASQFFGTFGRVLTASGSRRDTRVVCDMVNVSIGLAALLAARLRRIPTVGILTDMPGLMKGDVGLKARIAGKVNHAFMSHFDKYVFLSEPMREVNTRLRPDIIMEGLVRMNPAEATEQHAAKEKGKSIVYVGALYVKYGIRTLCQAMEYVSDPDVTLNFYGSGEMVEEIKALGQKDPRIRYHGVVSDAEIYEAETSAALLANPRPTAEAFAKYSFPSKVMEYMLSATPVLTTPLPSDYLEHVYIIDEETPQGIARAINSIFSLPEEERRAKGAGARKFVIEKKNHQLQAARILQLAFDR